MMNNIFIKIFIGTLTFFYIIYHRLLRERIPRELYIHLDNIKLFYYSAILSITFCLVIYNFYLIYKRKFKQKQKNQTKLYLYITNMYKYLKNPLNFFIDSLVSLDAFLKNKTPDYNERENYAHHITEIIAKSFIKFEKFSLLGLIIIRTSIQIFVCLMFFTDIIIYQKFYYFYNFLWMLLIPMIISYISYSINIHAKTNLNDLNSFITLRAIYRKDIDADNANSLENTEIISIDTWYHIVKDSNSESDEIICFNLLNEEIKFNRTTIDQVQLLEFYLQNINMYFNFRLYVDKYQEYKELVETPFNIFKYTIYSICWFYIINYAIHII